MIPMTPTPPTSKPADDSASITRKNTAVSRLKVSINWAEARIAKSFSARGPNPRADRNVAITSSWAWDCVKVESGTTRIWAWESSALRRLSPVVYGMTTQCWIAAEKTFSSGSNTPMTLKSSRTSRNGLDKRTDLPIGSNCPKRSVATPPEITTTLRDSLTSAGVKSRPAMKSP